MDSDSNDSSQWYSRCNNIFSGSVCFPVSGVIGLAAEECTPSGRSGAVFPQLLHKTTLASLFLALDMKMKQYETRGNQASLNGART